MSEITGAKVMPRRSRGQAATKAKADLRQVTWEATQFMTFSEIHDFVVAVLREVEGDEP